MRLRDLMPTTRLGRVSAAIALVLLVLILLGWVVAAALILGATPAGWAAVPGA